MKIYGFYYGVDGFGADTAPAFEEGFYTDLDVACEKCAKLNSDIDPSYFEEWKEYSYLATPEGCKKAYLEQTFSDPPISFYIVADSELIQ